MTHLKRPLHVPLRDRILASARELFYREGINTVSVDAIAAAAGTNKMSVYRNFPSKEDLVIAYLEAFTAETEAAWEVVRAEHPGDPEAQLRALLRRAAQDGCRGCAFVNAAIELAGRKHPALGFIEQQKNRQRERLIAICREAGFAHPERLADELFLLVEGARVSKQSVGPGGPGSRLFALAEALLDAAPRKVKRRG